MIVKRIESPTLNDKPSNCDTLAPLKTTMSAEETSDSLKLILLEDNREWDRCLFEAAEVKSGYQLRNFLTMILALCNVTYPNKLWKTHKNNLCEDILYRKRKETKNTNLQLNGFMIQTALIEVDLEFRKYDSSLSLFKDFPDLDIERFVVSSLILNNLNYNKEDLSE